jgi:hypothetical protein
MSHLHDATMDKNGSVDDRHRERVNGRDIAQREKRPQQNFVPQEAFVHAAIDFLKFVV